MSRAASHAPADEICHQLQAQQILLGLTLAAQQAHSSATERLCRSRRAQALAAQALQHQDRRAWLVSPAPSPSDLLWTNLRCASGSHLLLTLSWGSAALQRTCFGTHAVTAAVLLLCTVGSARTPARPSAESAAPGLSARRAAPGRSSPCLLQRLGASLAACAQVASALQVAALGALAEGHHRVGPLRSAGALLPGPCQRCAGVQLPSPCLHSCPQR